MNIFIDCEWNEFGGELISMALVTENGLNNFYEVLPCENPGPWVKENVMPKLGKKPVSKATFQSALMMWMNIYDEYHLHIIADWPEDIAHFCNMLITGPGQRIRTPELSFEIIRNLDAVPSANPHCAFDDAIALRESFYKR